MTPEQTAAYLASCAANRTKTDYFSSRGISEATAARFSLGYDGALSCVVLPCDDGHIVRRSTAEKRYLNEKAVEPREFIGEGRGPLVACHRRKALPQRKGRAVPAVPEQPSAR